MLGEKRPYHDICVQDGEASAEERSPPQNENPPRPTDATTPQDACGGGQEATRESPQDAGGGGQEAAGASPQDEGWGGQEAAEASPQDEGGEGQDEAGASPQDEGGGCGNTAGASPHKRSRLLETVSTVCSAAGGFVAKRRDWVAAEYKSFKSFCDDRSSNPQLAARLDAIDANFADLHRRMDDSLAGFTRWTEGVGDTASAVASSLEALSSVRTSGTAVVRHCPSCSDVSLLGTLPVILQEADGCTYDAQGKPNCYHCNQCNQKWNVCKKCKHLKVFGCACPTCPAKNPKP
jgi:hypothetical protein